WEHDHHTSLWFDTDLLAREVYLATLVAVIEIQESAKCSQGTVVGATIVCVILVLAADFISKDGIPFVLVDSKLFIYEIAVSRNRPIKHVKTEVIDTFALHWIRSCDTR